MKKSLKILFIIIMLQSCSSSNLDYIKNNAAQTWEEQGFQIVGYQGWCKGFGIGNTFGGAEVWYTLRRKDSSILYQGYLWRWGKEIHVYNLKAIDAIQPNN